MNCDIKYFSISQNSQAHYGSMVIPEQMMFKFFMKLASKNRHFHIMKWRENDKINCF